MRRTQIYLDEEQERDLARHAAVRHTSKSALIREAISAYLGGSAGETGRLERFRAAVRAAAGAAPYLPDGKEYVEELRHRDTARLDDLERRRR